MKRRIRLFLLWLHNKLLPPGEYDPVADRAGNFHAAWAAKREELAERAKGEGTSS